MGFVLVVDDDFTILELLGSHISTSTDFAVVTASSVEDAINKIKTYPKIEIVVSDYNMLIKNGDELLKFLYEKKLKIPFLFYSGSTELQNMHDYTYYMGYISKPKISELTEKLKSIKKWLLAAPIL